MINSNPYFVHVPVPENDLTQLLGQGFEFQSAISVPIDYQTFFNRLDVAIPNLVFHVGEALRAQLRNAVVDHLLQNHSDFVGDIVRWNEIKDALWRSVSKPTYGELDEGGADRRLSYSRERFDELLAALESIESKYGCIDPHRELLLQVRNECESYLDSLKPEQLG